MLYSNEDATLFQNNLIMSEQLELPFMTEFNHRKTTLTNSGTFINNMNLPIHRWFRYSAGFSAQWAEKIILNFINNQSPSTPNHHTTILDPFVGAGTTLLAADRYQVHSLGIEAHIFIARIAKIKLFWATSIDQFTQKAQQILTEALTIKTVDLTYPKLISQCFSETALTQLTQLKTAWEKLNDQSPASELIWLAINTILRQTSAVGTAQWQYILPNKTKASVLEVFTAFQSQIERMKIDMEIWQKTQNSSLANLILGDARHCPEIPDQSIDLVISSPPYANNYDYADATRLEMSFWGEVTRWGDLHQVIRKSLIVSSAQHASLEKLNLPEILQSHLLDTIKNELDEICDQLSRERLLHGGKKHYHTMVAGYFLDMAKVLIELKRVCKRPSQICLMIGDSAPYGIYVPVEEFLGKLAIASGFNDYSFEKVRDRNTKWKNRKHRLPLKEGILCIH